MKKIAKHSLMIVLAVVLCLCAAFVLGTTFAAEVTPGTITITPTSGSDITLDGTTTVAENVGGGTVTYDVENATVTLDGITAKKIVFTMNGDFLVNLVNENLIEDPGTTARIFHVASGNLTIDGSGSLKVVGNTTNYLFDSNGGGDTTIAGGKIEVIGESSSNTFRGSGNCTITGGYLYVKGKGETVRYTSTGKGFTMSGGKLEVETVGDTNSIYAAYIKISGGEINIIRTNSYGIRSTVDSLEISGGTISVSASNTNGYGIYSAKDLIISEANPDVPTNIHVDADYALAIPTASTKFNVTGGRITGSGNNLFYSSKTMTVTIGDNAIIDFDAKTAPLKGATVTVQSGATFGKKAKD